MLIVWKDKFAIDGGVIDDDHRVLFDTINSIVETSKGTCKCEAVLMEFNRLRDFAIRHFEREERLQRACGFPNQPDHHEQHEDLLDQLARFSEMAESAHDADVSQDKREQMQRKMQSFLYRWLLSHILAHDVKMRPFISAMTDTAATLSPLRAA